MKSIKSLFGSIIRQRVMAVIDAKIAQAEEELEIGTKHLEEKLEEDKIKLQDNIVAKLMAFIK